MIHLPTDPGIRISCEQDKVFVRGNVTAVAENAITVRTNAGSEVQVTVKQQIFAIGEKFYARLRVVSEQLEFEQALCCRERQRLRHPEKK